MESVTGTLNNFIVEPFLPHPSDAEYYVCINSAREGDYILFTHEGGVDIGDVDAKALKLDIPVGQHRALIGRGGQHLNDLQNRTGAQIQFPGSRSYNQVGEPENTADLAGVDPNNIVKVSGPRAACEKAVQELKVRVPVGTVDI